MQDVVGSQTLAGKYLTFSLGREEYGIEILRVREIFGYMPITSVPRSPEYLKGVINLRGQVIPVIDLRTKFNMPTVDVTDQTCIIDVEVDLDGKTIQTGIIVDQVCEVLDIAEEQIEKTDQFSNCTETAFIMGMAKISESVKILLDIDMILNDKNLADIAK